MDAVEVILLIINIILLLALLAQTRTRRAKRTVLMNGGRIYEDALSSAQTGIEELISQAREKGIFNIGDIDTAVLEENGKISFLLKPLSRQLTPRDFNFAPVRDGIPTVIVKNGEIIEENLAGAEIKREEIMTVLLSRGRRLENILLATVTESGRIDVFEKNAVDSAD